MREHQVKEALLSGQSVQKRGWTIQITANDTVDIWPPRGRGFSATLAHLDQAVRDFCKKAEMPEPGLRKHKDPVSLPKNVLGPDSSTKEFKCPKTISDSKFKMSPKELGTDSSKGEGFANPAITHRPEPRGKFPKTDLGKDTSGNSPKWAGRKRHSSRKRAGGEYLGNFGEYVNWPEYGGKLVFGGTYPRMVVVEPWGLMTREVEDINDPEMTWLLYDVYLDKYEIQDGKLVDETGRGPWFARHLETIADTVGASVQEVMESLSAENPTDRVFGYDAIGAWSGWDEFDDQHYWDIEGLRKWFSDTPELLKDLEDIVPNVEEDDDRTAKRSSKRAVYEDMDLLRDVDIDGYRLQLFDKNLPTGKYGHTTLSYKFISPEGKVIFEGDDYGVPRGQAVDSDETVRGLLGFLTIRPGDTDDEYFDNYTEDQLSFANDKGESMSGWGMDPSEWEDEEANEYYKLKDWEDRKASKRIADTFATDADPSSIYRELKKVRPSRELLAGIADPEKWAANQVLGEFEKNIPMRGKGQPGKGKATYSEGQDSGQIAECKASRKTKKALNEPRTTAPVFKGFLVDVTEYIREMPAGVKKVYDGYIFDETEATYIASMTPSIYCYYVGSICDYDMELGEEEKEVIYEFEIDLEQYGENDYFSLSAGKDAVLVNEYTEVPEDEEAYDAMVQETIESFRANGGLDELLMKKGRKASRKVAGPKLRERWHDDGGYQRDIEAESAEELHALVRGFGGEEVDWKQFQKPAEPINPVAKRRKGYSGLSDVATGYVEAALWSSTDESDDSGGEPMDRNYGIVDIEPDSLAKMAEDADTFAANHAEELAQYSELREGSHEGRSMDELIGHDLWLSANGHGTGFWDRGADEVGDALHAAAEKEIGESYLYVGDDGQVYCGGGGKSRRGSKGEDKQSVDEKAKDYYSKYMGDYGKKMTEKDVTDGPEKQKRQRGPKKGQATPPAAPPAAPPQEGPTPPTKPPLDPNAAPAAPAKTPAMKPGMGDAGLTALGWTATDIQSMDDEQKQKILQVKLNKPGTQPPKPTTAPKAPAAPGAPAAPTAPAAPAAPEVPETPVAGPKARRRAQAAPAMPNQAPQSAPQSAPKAGPAAPPQPENTPAQPPAGASKPLPEFAPNEEPTEDQNDAETQAFTILSEVQRLPVEAASPQEVVTLKTQALAQRLLSEAGMSIKEAEKLYGVGQKGLASLFRSW